MTKFFWSIIRSLRLVAFLAACLVALSPRIGAAPVELDTVTTYVADAKTISYEHPISVPDELLLVTVQFVDAKDSCQSITYGGLPLSRVGAISHSSDKPRVELWQLYNPQVGMDTIEVIIADDEKAKCVVAAVCFTGADPARPIDTCVTNSGKSTAGGLVVPSERGDLVYAAVVSLASGAPAPGTGSVLVWTSAIDAAKYGQGCYKPGTNTVNISWAFGASEEWAGLGVNLNHANARPLLAIMPDTTIVEGDTLHLSVSADDDDGTIPSLTASSLPPGATFSDHGDGTADFFFTASQTSAGEYEVLFVASDGALADSQLVAVTVEPLNVPPVLRSIGPKSVPLGSSLEFGVRADDADGTLPAFTTTLLPANAGLIDNGDGTADFTFTPDGSQVGVYGITFIAGDGELADSELVQISVLDTTVMGYVRVETIDGTPVGDTSLSTDDSLELYCRGYSDVDVLLGDVTVTWQVIGVDSIAVAPSESEASVTMQLSRPGTGRIIAIFTSEFTDTTGVVTCTPGLPDRLQISPPSSTMELGDTIQFSVVAYDGDSNLTSPGVISWEVLGFVGEIDSKGLFVSNSPGSGQIAVTTDRSSAVDTSGSIVVQAIFVEPVALGTANVYAGQNDVVLLAFSVANYYRVLKTITSVTVRDVSRGAGTREQIGTNFDSVKVYLDRDLSYTRSNWDTLLVATTWGSGPTFTCPCALDLVPGQEEIFLLVSNVSEYPHDSDSLDFCFTPATDLAVSDLTPARGRDTVNSYGFRIIDGMVAGQIQLGNAALDSIDWTDGPVPVLSIDVPRNGYQADTLTSFSVENEGSAGEFDLDSLYLCADDGDGLWDGGTLDRYLVGLSYTGRWWNASGFRAPLDSQLTRLYVVAAASRFALRGATLELGLPQYGLAVSSRNDGPLDEPLPPCDTVTILSDRELSVSLTQLPGGTAAWGSVTTPLLSLLLTNHSGTETEIDSITLTSYAADPHGASQAQLDQQYDSVMLYHDLDGIPSTMSGADTILAVGQFVDGKITFSTPGLVLDEGAGVAHLAVAAAVSPSGARDGTTIRVGMESGDKLYCSPPISVTGSYPLVNTQSQTIVGFPAAAVTRHALADNEYVGGQKLCPLFHFALPGNGYAVDTLETLRLINRGSLSDGDVLRNMRLWCDLTGNGYTLDDILLVSFVRIGSEWVAGPMAALVSPGGATFVMTADISTQAFRAGTFLPSLPVRGVTYRSGLDGPDDASVSSPLAILIMPADRITVISLGEYGGIVDPGESNVPVLAFALYNGYADAKSFSGLSLYNLSHSAGDADYADRELGQLRLYNDRLGQPTTDSTSLLVAGYFSEGHLRLDGFEVSLPAESLSYFFVAADVSIDATDSDTLIVAVPEAADFSFAQTVSLNGDLPLQSGQPLVVDGSVAAQYTVLPLPSRSIRPGDSAQLLLAFRPAHNGAVPDVLQGLSIAISGSSDLDAVRLWLDRDGDARCEPGDSLLGPMTFSVNRWNISSLSVEVDSTRTALFVVADISAGASSGTIIQANIPIDGCTFASDNDGPRDHALPPGGTFTVYSSQLQVAGTGMRSTYSVDETIPVGLTVDNLFGVTLTSVTSEALTQGDVSAVSFDSCSAPLSLDPSESGTLTCYYTGLQTGEISWSMRALAPGIPDSSAFIATTSVKIQSQPSAAAVDLLNSAPASVTKGQRNVFPLTIRIAHPDTGAFAAEIRIEGISLTVRSGTGETQAADNVFSRMALGADFSNYAIAYPVPSTAGVTLTFPQPVIVRPGLEEQLVLLVDIDSSSQASSFMLSLDGPEALLVFDNNTGDPVTVLVANGFPLSTDVCRVDLPSQCLAVSSAMIEDLMANRGQEGVVSLGVQVRHPGAVGASPVQLTAVTVEFVDTTGGLLSAAEVASQLSLRSSGVEWGAVPGTALDTARVAISLSSPITFGPGESRTLEVTCSLSPTGTADGFRITVPDSTCLVIREIGSGATLPATTDTDVLSTSSAFPIYGGWVDINVPAEAPRICLTSSAPSSIVAGADSVAFLDIQAAYPYCPDCSPVQIDRVRVGLLDSVGVPLDPQRAFRRIGTSVSGSPIWYQPYVELVNGDVQFRFGDSGLRLLPGDSVQMRLIADVDNDSPYDNLVLQIETEDKIVVWDAADPIHHPGITTAPSCELVFPYEVGPAVIIQPAGRPGVAPENGNVIIAYQGEADVPLIALDIDYDHLVRQGDLEFYGLSGQVYKRTASGTVPIDASALMTSASLWMNDSLLVAVSVSSGQILDISLPQPLIIRQGDQMHLQLKGDIQTSAERTNYLFALEDSLAVALRDPQLLATVCPLTPDGGYPLYGAELSVTAASLEESFTNYPNPFIASRGEATTIAFVLPEPARVHMGIYTITGELVVDLASNELRSAGEHQTDQWFGLNGRGKAVIPGTYFCRMTVQYLSGREETLQRKVAVIR